MIESIFLPGKEGCAWQGSNDEDFERKLLLHCEAHAHEDESVEDTTFKEDGNDESSIRFTMFQIEAGEQNDSPSDVINIVSTIHEENETEIEVTMQTLCESCAMDVTDVTDFVDQYQCPFCMAAKNFDFNLEDDSSSLSQDGNHVYIQDGDHHDKKQLNSALSTAVTQEGMKRVKEFHKKTTATDGNSKNQLLKRMTSSLSQDGNHVYIQDGDHHDKKQLNSALSTAVTQEGMTRVKEFPKKTTATDGNSKNQLLKGMIATFLHENKKNLILTPESRDDISSLTKPKTLANGGRSRIGTRTHDNDDVLRDLNIKKEAMEKYNLYHSGHHRLRELKKFEAPYSAKKSMIINHVDALDVRYQLLQLENYYSKQQHREEFS